MGIQTYAWTWTSQPPYSCFNPCCIGLGIQTLFRAADFPAASVFQSLLYWIGHSDSAGVTVGWKTLGMFQSLLYWIGHSDKCPARCCSPMSDVSILVVLDWAFRPRFERRRRNPRIVSILVVLDWAFRQTDMIIEKPRNPRFQSLLYWIGHSDTGPAPLWRRSPGVSILVVLDWAFRQPNSNGRNHERMEFQSLLYWIGHSDGRV